MEDVERTLPASERRRAWAREQGYSARSAAFTGAVSLAAAAALWLWTGPAVVDQLASRLKSRLQERPALSLDLDSAASLLQGDFLALGLFAVWGMAAVWGTAAVVNLAQTGFQWSPAAMSADLSRVNPFEGMNRLFSAGQVVTALWSIVVLAGVAGGAFIAVQTFEFSRAWQGSLEATLRRTSDDLSLLALQLAGLVVALCVLDVVRRRWTLETSLRMTADEQREEAGRTPATRRR
ncbi:flagellar biosynthesis protein FlhB [Caulifigura coniformis]|uniref:Flagellar biosynthesis protein FlhB n=1 Tax=Caulifigura coniformis TaxID=2527983 RepID=A0A517SD39_9PLAN|nr:EscU/YscU/HrcU family type III secretion system export apparatus switch protein [Caulifigura coniformis]QDT54044.1 flagellar biosynthesis protein FlhB [Caulifigura coniformis]